MSAAERFQSKVYPEPNTGCHLWGGGTNRDGYGMMWLNGKQTGAHRVAWGLLRGPVPDGLCVLHRCDVRHRVNPEHLFLGTKGDNNRDCGAKGRYDPRAGEQNKAAKLTASDVAKIRRAHAAGEGNYPALGRKHGISGSQVGNIVRRECWVQRHGAG